MVPEQLNFDQLEDFVPNNRSKNNRSNNMTIRRSFEEDLQQRTQVLSKRGADSKPGSILPQALPVPPRNFEAAKTARRRETPRHFNSDGESEASCNDELTEEWNSKILDDTFLDQKVAQRSRTEYFNILIIGGANLGKFGFIKHLFRSVFDRPINLNKDAGEVNEFVHEFLGQNGTRKVITLVHIQGHSKDFPIPQWYKSIKSYIMDKMRTFHDVRKLYANDKRLQKETPVDSRVHLCLHFVPAPKPRLNELIHMKKIQKLVPVLPVIVCREGEARVDTEYVRSLKASVIKELQDIEMEVPNLQENNFGVRQFRNGLVGRAVPFYINPISSGRNQDTDLNNLLKLPLHNVADYFRYRSEMLYSIHVDKVVASKPNFKKHKKGGDSDDDSVKVGVGVAVGITLLGAFYAFKSKLF